MPSQTNVSFLLLLISPFLLFLLLLFYFKSIIILNILQKETSIDVHLLTPSNSLRHGGKCNHRVDLGLRFILDLLDLRRPLSLLYENFI